MLRGRDFILWVFLSVCWIGTLYVPFLVVNRVSEPLSIELSPEHIELKNKTEITLEELYKLQELDQEVMNRIKKSTQEKGFSISLFRNKAIYFLAIGWLLLGLLVKQLSYRHVVFVFLLFIVGAVFGLVTIAEFVLYPLVLLVGHILRTKIASKFSHT